VTLMPQQGPRRRLRRRSSSGAPRRIRGRPSGLKGANASRCARQPCGPPLTPETTAAPRARKGGQAGPAPRCARRAAPGGGGRDLRGREPGEESV
jgi:hypothetical protein